jgi:hypothetical protein
VSTSQGGSGTVATYQPSSVIRQAPGHLQLSSPDSVTKISAFYDSALAGWTIVSSKKNPFSTNVTARRGNQGVTVSINTAGPAGTMISVSTYPV